MSNLLFVVDDLPSRAHKIVNKSNEHGFTTKWLRPLLKSSFEIVDAEFVIEQKTKEELITYISNISTKNNIWIWDVELIFKSEGLSEKFSTDDYKWGIDESGNRIGDEPKLRKLLIHRLLKGDVIILTSASSATSIICDDIKNSIGRNYPARLADFPADWNALDSDNDESTRTTKDEWVNQVILKAISLASDKPKFSELWNDAHKCYFTPKHNIIPHDFEACSWDNFMPFLRDVVGGESLVSVELMTELENNFEGCFYSIMTLIGSCAKCHNGISYAPSLSVIGLLIC